MSLQRSGDFSKVNKRAQYEVKGARKHEQY